MLARTIVRDVYGGQEAARVIAAQAVALIFNGTVYPLLAMMFVASALSLLSFRLGVPARRTGVRSV